MNVRSAVVSGVRVKVRILECRGQLDVQDECPWALDHGEC
jgi:hypothetical protein